MEKKPQSPKEQPTGNKTKAGKNKSEKELDPDNEMHKTSPDLIRKEDHHLPVDDEIKKG